MNSDEKKNRRELMAGVSVWEVYTQGGLNRMVMNLVLWTRGFWQHGLKAVNFRKASG